MFKAKTVNNFLKKDDCEYLVNSVKNSDVWSDAGGDFWKGRAINLGDLKKADIYAFNIALNARNKVAQKIKELYGYEKIYSDLFQVIRWFPGTEQPPHADDMKNINDVGYEWFYHREIASIIYLNDDYTGGKTYYPQYNIFIDPECGKLAIHPGDESHLHGVTKINDKIRYTLAGFWTTEREYADEWSLS